MHVNFTRRPGGPERLAAEAELHFTTPFGAETESLLADLKLIGFCVWRGGDGVFYVTLPSRAFGAGSERRFFDYIRPVDDGTDEPVRRLKRWILEEFVKWYRCPGHLAGREGSGLSCDHCGRLARVDEKSGAPCAAAA